MLQRRGKHTTLYARMQRIRGKKRSKSDDETLESRQGGDDRKHNI